MDIRNNIARRAVLAVQRARAEDQRLHELTPDRLEWRQRAAHTRTLATILGVDPATAIVTRDPIRSTRYPAYLLTVYDDTPDATADITANNTTGETGRDASGETPGWHFVPDIVDGSYLLLGLCRGCGHEVPTHVIASLVDLGRVLEGSGTDALSTPAAARDAGHHTECPLYQPADI
jgi:hypothetical protein